MPKTKITKKSGLDKFYTKIAVADKCSDIASKYLGDLFVIEPSAGGGAFSSVSDLMIDIEPEESVPNTIKMDFMDFDGTITNKSMAFVGNPPFGERGNTIKKFIGKMLSFEKTEVIALVLPNTYMKVTNQSIFPSNWGLAEIYYLPKNSFTLNGEDYHVPCVFQVWVKDFPPSLREIDHGDRCQDFKFSKTGDFFIFGASPSKIIKADDKNKNNRGYFIESTLDIEELRGRLSCIDWKIKGNSSVNGGVAWFTKSEIIKAYTEVWNEHK